ncbi:hypothetical protein SAMN05421788_10388 [Filimonas lacunae]|uniref:Uncharacterized protein n=1 Tax=Filimonas lacunae TaxID=477680 RepID=A0A173MJU1_9BACT|nr:hypothetical protein [Filimonas lacunae]BAV07736.1 hypothetical protein FLA_3767 [Filimonas lacunae]SIT04236.1 hypothetical protein SAMN05421788_10388 [Filimonas lacunae]
MKKHSQRLAYLLGTYLGSSLDIYEEIELKTTALDDADVEEMVEEFLVPLEHVKDPLEVYPDRKRMAAMHWKLITAINED